MAFPRSDLQNPAVSAPTVNLRSGLIVTASPATRRMYAEYLEWRGVSVREVTNATAALDHLSAFTPDVVIIEDKLEDGRGVNLVLTLRRSRRTSHIPIALLSGDVFGMSPVRAHRFGCDLLIPIPCLPNTLFDALVQLVGDGVTHRESDVLDSWLFVRGDESVRIVRQGDFELSVCGPGSKRGVCRFGSELEVSTYQADYEQRLVNTGFTFEAFRKDRRGGGDRRLEFSGPERGPASAREEAADARGLVAHSRRPTIQNLPIDVPQSTIAVSNRHQR